MVDNAPEASNRQASTEPGVVSEPTNGETATDPVETPAAPSSRLKNRRGQKPQAPPARSSCSQESIVYLTADAEDELTELKEGETYVIGGIVDKNRYKNLCANKAKELNIRSARLPIGRYLADMPTRKVLTVNQVFDILAYWVSTRDWEQAMQKVMPKRKFNADGKKGKRAKKASTSEAGEADEDEDEADEQEELTKSGDENVETTES